MTQYSSVNVKLSNSKLKKLKSAIKNENDVVMIVLQHFHFLLQTLILL